MDIYIDFENYTEDEAIYRRTAARAIISRGDKYLLITSRFGDAKFPGGGKEDDEELVTALTREMKEETGYQIVQDSIEKYGIVTEKRRSRRGPGVMIMDSHYYLCKVMDHPGERMLEPYEIEYEYENVWMTLEEAIAKNKQIKNIAECPWVAREIEVMEKLL